MRKLVCIKNGNDGGYITKGKIYDVTIMENGNAIFINDYGDKDIFSGLKLYDYFIGIKEYRNNLIEDILS